MQGRRLALRAYNERQPGPPLRASATSSRLDRRRRRALLKDRRSSYRDVVSLMRTPAGRQKTRQRRPGSTVPAAGWERQPEWSASMVAFSGRGRQIGRAIIVASAIVALLLVSGAPVAAAGPTTWHRLQPRQPARTRTLLLPRRLDLDLPLRQVAGARSRLRLEPDTWRVHGVETGFVCPEWFSAASCDAADTVITGMSTFRTYDYSLRPTGSFSVDQQLLVSDDGTLWIYWVGQFVCRGTRHSGRRSRATRPASSPRLTWRRDHRRRTRPRRRVRPSGYAMVLPGPLRASATCDS